MARALCEDAQLMCEAGLDESEIVQELGDPKRRADEITRVTLQNVGLFGRFRWLVWRVSKVVWLAGLVAYAVLFIQFHLGKPNVARNFAKEHNDSFAHVPMEDRAEPLYRSAAQQLDLSAVDQIERWPDVFPGDVEWTAVAHLLEENRAALSTIKEATTKPIAGFVWTDAIDQSWTHKRFSSNEQRSASQNPYVLGIVQPYLGRMRSFARVLRSESRLALSEGDNARLHSNLLASIRMAHHAASDRALISRLVGVAVVGLTLGTIDEAIRDAPGLLTSEQLEQVDAALERFRSSELEMSFARETITLEDCLQRWFTDDGRGDGRLCAPGMREMIWQDRRGNGDLGLSGWLGGPLVSARMAGRRELLDEQKRLISIVETEWQQPAWRRGESAIEAELDRIDNDPRLRRRFSLVTPLLTAIEKAARAFENANMMILGTRVVIAIERHRLARGAYPESLEQLVPEFLADVPVDMHDGAPLRYRLTPEGPLLYSVGGDTKDDGGRRAEDVTGAWAWRPPSRRSWAPSGDWVFYPPEPRKAPDPQSTSTDSPVP